MAPSHVPYVDPRCAICTAPAEASCGCEARALEVAISQAEGRFFSPMFMDVRSWVRARARDYILDYYREISKPCRTAYARHRDVIRATYRAKCPPEDPEPNYRNAERIYRKNIDEAWSLAVLRYPEVLDYFFSLVHISLPDDQDPVLQQPSPGRRRHDDSDDGRPPFNRLGEFRHRRRRVFEPKRSAPIPAFPIPPRQPNGQPAVAGRPGWPTPPPSPQAFPQQPQPGAWSMR
ncbi:hypothetical protein ISF_03346 [Cordyceps fumosorosea ARSEF 2679]|uniref:Serine/threonine protein phosphatase n=1 Tax=Cordyceps fumosorosea (strain ARSEF 2679) TaxID=1081104 RepID=A0A168ANC3_CORFA|nr:hypothetical protein ISF_03346 [Cordyceps fumosorosea ARSEF 2679]OAA68971.1 hypothetical protein ISF_03346 [Cordyceps fumosorosea ARSEF 2679]